MACMHAAGLEDAELSAAKKVLAEEQRKVAAQDSLELLLRAARSIR